MASCCLSAWRTPCLEPEYISLCGGRSRMCAGSGRPRAGAPPGPEKRWRVWQAHTEAMPYASPALHVGDIGGALEPNLWAAASALETLRGMAMGCQWMVGIAFIGAHARGVLAGLELGHAVSVETRCRCRGVGILASLAHRLWYARLPWHSHSRCRWPCAGSSCQS